MIALCSKCLVRIASLILVAFYYNCKFWIIILLEELPRRRGVIVVAILKFSYFYSIKITFFFNLGDGQSSNSSVQTTTHSKDRSQADGSSLDLEWEHEEGTDGTDRVSFIMKSPSSH